MLFIHKGRKHRFATERFLLGRSAHWAIWHLLSQIRLILWQCLVCEDVERRPSNRFCIRRSWPAMRSYGALKALSQGWQVYFWRQGTRDILSRDHRFVRMLQRCVLEHLPAIQTQGLGIGDDLLTSILFVSRVEAALSDTLVGHTNHFRLQSCDISALLGLVAQVFWLTHQSRVDDLRIAYCTASWYLKGRVVVIHRLFCWVLKIEWSTLCVCHQNCTFLFVVPARDIPLRLMMRAGYEGHCGGTRQNVLTRALGRSNHSILGQNWLGSCCPRTPLWKPLLELCLQVLLYRTLRESSILSLAVVKQLRMIFLRYGIGSREVVEVVRDVHVKVDSWWLVQCTCLMWLT